MAVDWLQLCFGWRCAAAFPVWHRGRLNRTCCRDRAVILIVQILREMPVVVFALLVRFDLLITSGADVSLLHDACDDSLARVDSN